jgi:hypothetical protein
MEGVMPDDMKADLRFLEMLAVDLDYAAMPTKPDVVTLCGSQAARVRDEIRALLSERRKMVEALEPFAKAGRVWLTATEPDDAKVFCDLWQDTMDAMEFGEAPPISDPEFTVGDFRRAAALTGSREHG